MIEKQKIQAIFSYLYNPSENLTKAEGAFVFGRESDLVAKRVAELYDERLIDYAMITGGIGKDSGYLAKLNTPEAAWQAALLHIAHKVPEDIIYIESKAKNGGECCRFGIDTIIEKGLPHDNLIIVVHPTSLRRVWATLEQISLEKNFSANYQKTGIDYQFNSDNPTDQKEAIAELLRLTDWPEKGWCMKQHDLPLDLVEYAREINGKI